jgi:hypothetical protein
MKRIWRHVSYANVAATLALVLAMSGGAIAATGGFSSGGTLRACANEEGAIRLLKPGKKCKKGQTAVAWNQTGPAGAPGAKGASGANGAAGAQGAQGGQGGQGPQGTALAYAHVTKGATLDTTNSSGVVDVRRYTGFSTGFYCLYGNFTPHVATATIDYDENSGNEFVQDLGFSGSATSGCPTSPTGAPVRAAVLVRYYVSGLQGDLVDAGFYIIFN